MHDEYFGGQASVAIRVEARELQTGDVIASHDDLYHVVDAVAEYDDGRIVANMTRGSLSSGGGRYSVEFQPDDSVEVMA